MFQSGLSRSLCCLLITLFSVCMSVHDQVPTSHAPTLCLRNVQAKPQAGQEWNQPSGCWCDGKEEIVNSCRWWISDWLRRWGPGLKARAIWGMTRGTDAPQGQRADSKLKRDTERGEKTPGQAWEIKPKCEERGILTPKSKLCAELTP